MAIDEMGVDGVGQHQSVCPDKQDIQVIYM